MEIEVILEYIKEKIAIVKKRKSNTKLTDVFVNKKVIEKSIICKENRI